MLENFNLNSPLRHRRNFIIVLSHVSWDIIPLKFISLSVKQRVKNSFINVLQNID